LRFRPIVMCDFKLPLCVIGTFSCVIQTFCCMGFRHRFWVC